MPYDNRLLKGGVPVLFLMQTFTTEEERRSFEALYQKYRRLMRAAAMKLLSDPQDAEDAVQQAFLSIMKHFHKFSRIDCPETRAYVVITVERKALDSRRAKRRVLPMEPEELRPGLEAPQTGDNGLADALTRLPARYRQVLLLRFAYGYTTRELAREMGMTQEAVQKLIWRAKQALEKLYEEGGNQR